MRIVDVMILIGIILGILFPSFLINSIRSKDEEAASSYKIKASITFGAIILIILATIRS